MRGDRLRGLRRAFDRARVHRRDRQRREPVGRGFGLLAALVGEVDAGHAARQQRAGVLGDGMAHEHETRRRLRRVFGRVGRRRVVGFAVDGCVGARRASVTCCVIRPRYRRRSCVPYDLRHDRREPLGLGPARDRARAGTAGCARRARSRARAARGRATRRGRGRVRPLAAVPRRVGAARRARARRRRALRVLPRRLSPRPRPAAAVGMARHRLRALEARDESRVPARARRPARRRPRRSARPTKRSAARSSCTSSTRGLGRRRPSSVHQRVKRALITGITGQDGRHLSQFLTAKGYQVFGLVRGQNNPKIDIDPGREPGARARRGRPARPVVADRGRRAGATRRGLQPRRDQLRAALVQAGRAHRGDHRPRRAAHARSGAHRRRLREQPDPLLPGVVVGDVRQGARDAADRADAVPPALAVRRRQGVRSLHDAQLPRGVRHPREQRHPLQPRRPEARARVRHPQGHERRRADQARAPGHRSASATSTRSATGATRATTSRRCG